MIRVNELIRRRSRRLAVVLALLALAASVTWAHDGAAMDQMGNTAVMCLAVLAAGASVLLVRTPRFHVGPRAPRRLRPPAGALVARPALPYARAGPDLLQRFLL